MAKKPKAKVTKDESDKEETKQVRIAPDLHQMIIDMVGNKKGAAGRYIEKMIRERVKAEHREWLGGRMKLHGMEPPAMNSDLEPRT